MTAKNYDVSKQAKPPDEAVELKRKIRLVDAVFIIIGSVIGTGIFITPVSVYENSGSVGTSLVIWGACGVHSMLGALVYTELGILIPRSGADYAYYKETLGRPPAFMYMWAMLMAPQASRAAQCLAFATYVTRPFFLHCEPPPSAIEILALLMIGAVAIVNCRSVWLTLRIINVLTVLKLVPLVTIIITGFYFIMTDRVENLSEPFRGTKSPGDISTAVYSALFTYSGYNAVCYLMEELKNPSVNLPKAIYIALPIITLIYLSANVGYFTVLNRFEILASPAIAVTFSAKVLGFFKYVFPIFVGFSIVGGVMGGLFSHARLYYAGSQDGAIPEFMSYIHYTYFTPVPSVLFIWCLVVFLIIFSGNIFDLLKYATITDVIANVMSVVSLLILRFKESDSKREVKISIFVPIMFLLTSLSVLIVSLIHDPINNSIGVLLLALGLPGYFIGEKVKSFGNGNSDFIMKAVDFVNKLVSKFFLSIPPESEFIRENLPEELVKEVEYLECTKL